MKNKEIETINNLLQAKEPTITRNKILDAENNLCKPWTNCGPGGCRPEHGGCGPFCQP
jgi:hypothetical protein